MAQANGLRSGEERCNDVTWSEQRHCDPCGFLFGRGPEEGRGERGRKRLRSGEEGEGGRREEENANIEVPEERRGNEREERGDEANDDECSCGCGGRGGEGGRRGKNGTENGRRKRRRGGGGPGGGNGDANDIENGVALPSLDGTVWVFTCTLIFFVTIVVATLAFFLLVGCPAETFRCDDGTCVPRPRLCDDHRDCPRGEDELDRVCQDVNTMRRMPDLPPRSDIASCALTGYPGFQQDYDIKVKILAILRSQNRTGRLRSRPRSLRRGIWGGAERKDKDDVTTDNNAGGKQDERSHTDINKTDYRTRRRRRRRRKRHDVTATDLSVANDTKEMRNCDNDKLQGKHVKIQGNEAVTTINPSMGMVLKDSSSESTNEYSTNWDETNIIQARKPITSTSLSPEEHIQHTRQGDTDFKRHNIEKKGMSINERIVLDYNNIQNNEMYPNNYRYDKNTNRRNKAEFGKNGLIQIQNYEIKQNVLKNMNDVEVTRKFFINLQENNFFTNLKNVLSKVPLLQKEKHFGPSRLLGHRKRSEEHRKRGFGLLQFRDKSTKGIFPSRGYLWGFREFNDQITGEDMTTAEEKTNKENDDTKDTGSAAEVKKGKDILFLDTETGRYKGESRIGALKMKTSKGTKEAFARDDSIQTRIKNAKKHWDWKTKRRKKEYTPQIQHQTKIKRKRESSSPSLVSSNLPGHKELVKLKAVDFQDDEGMVPISSQRRVGGLEAGRFPETGSRFFQTEEDEFGKIKGRRRSFELREMLSRLSHNRKNSSGKSKDINKALNLSIASEADLIPILILHTLRLVGNLHHYHHYHNDQALYKNKYGGIDNNDNSTNIIGKIRGFPLGQSRLVERSRRETSDFPRTMKNKWKIHPEVTKTKNLEKDKKSKILPIASLHEPQISLYPKTTTLSSIKSTLLRRISRPPFGNSRNSFSETLQRLSLQEATPHPEDLFHFEKVDETPSKEVKSDKGNSKRPSGLDILATRKELPGIPAHISKNTITTQNRYWVLQHPGVHTSTTTQGNKNKKNLEEKDKMEDINVKGGEWEAEKAGNQWKYNKTTKVNVNKGQESEIEFKNEDCKEGRNEKKVTYKRELEDGERKGDYEDIVKKKGAAWQQDIVRRKKRNDRKREWEESEKENGYKTMERTALLRDRKQRSHGRYGLRKEEKEWTLTKRQKAKDWQEERHAKEEEEEEEEEEMKNDALIKDQDIYDSFGRKHEREIVVSVGKEQKEYEGKGRGGGGREEEGGKGGHKKGGHLAPRDIIFPQRMPGLLQLPSQYSSSNLHPTPQPPPPPPPLSMTSHRNISQFPMASALKSQLQPPTQSLPQPPSVLVLQPSQPPSLMSSYPEPQVTKDDEDFGVNSVSGGVSGFQAMENPPRPTSMSSMKSEERVRCTCESSTQLACGSSLTRVPAGIVGNISKLVLASNRIRNLDNLSFYPTLRTLHLAKNLLDHVNEGTFEALADLQELVLSENQLHHLAIWWCRGLRSLRTLHLDANQLSHMDLGCFTHTPQLTYLNLARNLLRLHDDIFPTLPELTVLFLDHNNLGQVSRVLLSNLPNLDELHLSYNRIVTVHPKAFASLRNLRTLDLEGNAGITTLAIFSPLSALTSLRLRDIILDASSLREIENLTNLEFVYFERFQYCSYVPQNAYCGPFSDGISSRENLLHNTLLRVSIWVVGVLTLIGNAFVIFCRTIFRADNKILKIFIKNLAISDLLMGVYLLLVGVQDVRTRGQYHEHSRQWSASHFCSFAGCLAMVSSETSVFILVFMTLERYLYITQALGGLRLSKRLAYLCLTVIWSVSFLLALFPVLWMHSLDYYGHNAMCFPLHIDEPFHAGWQYSAFVFLGLDSISILVIIACYVSLFRNIRGTRLATPLASVGVGVGDMNFALRFFFIVLTDCVCWLPVMVAKVLALAEVRIPSEVNAWLMVMVVPINSAFNPVLYTFSTSHFQTQVKGAFHLCSSGSRAGLSDTDFHRLSSKRSRGSLVEMARQPRQWRGSGYSNGIFHLVSTCRGRNTSFRRQRDDDYFDTESPRVPGTMQTRLMIMTQMSFEADTTLGANRGPCGTPRVTLDPKPSGTLESRRTGPRWQEETTRVEYHGELLPGRRRRRRRKRGSRTPEEMWVGENLLLRSKSRSTFRSLDDFQGGVGVRESNFGTHESVMDIQNQSRTLSPNHCAVFDYRTRTGSPESLEEPQGSKCSVVTSENVNTGDISTRHVILVCSDDDDDDDDDDNECKGEKVTFSLMSHSDSSSSIT
ncbi:uncharacterized protein LOC143027721 [Oratosquilla oratoria]|uniref:uncharacterized protein LOC143027721 n=1 Tax=Oratosquilla oratoria TaxID=337810 RepID=UPI003F76AB94